MKMLPRSTPAVIIASGVLALTLAAGGGAVAGSLVTSAQIKDNTIRSADVQDGTLRLKDIAGGAQDDLAGQDGVDGAEGPVGPAGSTGADGEDGGTGPAGPTGPTGPIGPAGWRGPSGVDGVDGTNGTDGADGVSGWERLVNSAAADTIEYVSVPVTCPGGKRVLSAHGYWEYPHSTVNANIQADGQTVYVYGLNTRDEPNELNAMVICATVN
jgi:hypothetical protein